MLHILVLDKSNFNHKLKVLGSKQPGTEVKNTFKLATFQPFCK